MLADTHPRHAPGLNGAGYFEVFTPPSTARRRHPKTRRSTFPSSRRRPSRLEAGIGSFTNTAFCGNVSYKDVNFLGHALQFSADARLESKLQNGSLRLVQPPNAAGWSTVWSTRLERTDISGLVTQSFIAGARRDLARRTQPMAIRARLRRRSTAGGQRRDDFRARGVRRCRAHVASHGRPAVANPRLHGVAPGRSGDSGRIFGKPSRA